VPEIPVTEFDERLASGQCSQDVRDIVTYLRKAAVACGAINWRAHSTHGGGWGITAKTGNRVVCHLDPKPNAGHVCVCIPGVDELELKPAGTVHRRKDAPPWTDIRDLHGAAVVAPLMARAYRSAASDPAPPVAAGRRASSGGSGSAPVGAPVATHAGAVEDVRQELRRRGFVRVGAIRPVGSGRACKAELDALHFLGRVVYGLVVGDDFKKCGDTGRKNATLKKRMDGCANTINAILSGALVGPFTEHFKSRAPAAIEEMREIEVGAREATDEECRRLQRELNRNYDTIRRGWADRLE
jgi:hypothetical protein